MECFCLCIGTMYLQFQLYVESITFNHKILLLLYLVGMYKNSNNKLLKIELLLLLLLLPTYYYYY